MGDFVGLFYISTQSIHPPSFHSFNSTMLFRIPYQSNKSCELCYVWRNRTNNSMNTIFKCLPAMLATFFSCDDLERVVNFIDNVLPSQIARYKIIRVKKPHPLRHHHIRPQSFHMTFQFPFLLGVRWIVICLFWNPVNLCNKTCTEWFLAHGDIWGWHCFVKWDKIQATCWII